MRKLILLIAALAGATVVASAQNGMYYEYDASGNRTARKMCVASYANQTVSATTTVVACDNITVRQVTVNATLTIKASGTITVGSGVVVGSSGRLILETQGSGRVVIDDKYDLSAGDVEVK